MSKNIPIKPLLSLFASFFLLNLISQINSSIVPSFLMEKGLRISELEDIELLEILSTIVAGLLLIQTVNLIRGKKILLVSLISFFISILGITVVTDHSLMAAFLIIMSASVFSYNVLSLITACNYSPAYKKFILGAFFILWVVGISAAENINDFLKQHNPNYVLIINILTCGILVIINSILVDIDPIQSMFADSKFSDLIKNIELQLVTILVISYITIDIFWYYDILALIENLPISDVDLVQKYVLYSISLFIIPLLSILDMVNRYLLNILFITVFYISILILLNIDTTTTTNIITFGLFGICIYATFICNILILHDKFDGKELRTSLILYFTMCSVGEYVGALSSYRANNITAERHFLISLYLIIAALLLYHIWHFIKFKSYKLK